MKFRETNTIGKIAMMSAAGVILAAQSAVAGANGDFTRVDQNNDNSVEWQEIQQTYEEDLAQKEWDEQKIFESFDENSDGALDDQEYQAFVEAMENEPQVSAASGSAAAAGGTAGAASYDTENASTDSEQGSDRVASSQAAGAESESYASGAMSDSESSDDRVAGSQSSDSELSTTESSESDRYATDTERRTNEDRVTTSGAAAEESSQDETTPDGGTARNMTPSSGTEGSPAEPALQEEPAMAAETANAGADESDEDLSEIQREANQDTDSQDSGASGSMSESGSASDSDTSSVNQEEQEGTARNMTPSAGTEGSPSERALQQEPALSATTDAAGAAEEDSDSDLAEIQREDSEGAQSSTQGGMSDSQSQTDTEYEAGSQYQAGTAGSATVQGKSAEELTDQEVVNQQGDTVGTVQDVVRSQTGDETGLVVSVGGFMGFGGKDIVVDADEVEVAEDQITWQTDAGRDEIRDMPEYNEDEYVEVR